MDDFNSVSMAHRNSKPDRVHRDAITPSEKVEMNDSNRLHPDVEKLLLDLEAASLPKLTACSPREARAFLASLRPQRSDAATMWRVADEQIGDTVRCRIYEPVPETRATILYFHGGGWVLGDLDTSDFAVRALAAATGCRIVSVDYRLAPEHPFPAAVADASAALRWTGEVMRDREYLGPLIVAGDSAGANLAAGLSLHSVCAGLPPIAAQILVYPVTDCDFSRASYNRFADAAPLSGREMRWFWEHYCKDPTLRTDPRARILGSGELRLSPPTFLALASHDPLLDEGAEFAASLMRQAVPVSAKLYAGTVHGFFSMPDRLAPARELLGDISDYVRRITGPDRQDKPGEQ